MGKIRNHILFWLLYIAFTVSVYYVKEPWLGLHLLYELASLPAKLLAVYSVVYWILPQYILRRKYHKVILATLLVLTLGVGLLHLAVTITVYPIFFPEVSASAVLTDPGKLVAPTLDLVVVCSLAVVVKLIRDREETERKQLEREKINLDNELKLLKSQLHPHFLFNTLNGLYTCTLQDPQLASKIVIMLSDLLRYIIYEANKPVVMLDDDVKALKNYLELEKLRHGESLKTSFFVKGDTTGKQIPPLLLLPFVENAFKHKRSSGKSNTIEGGIELSVGGLKFHIYNTAEEKHEPSNHSGMGLVNVRQRLNLYYGDKYRLFITNDNGLYKVELNLPLQQI